MIKQKQQSIQTTTSTSTSNSTIGSTGGIVGTNNGNQFSNSNPTTTKNQTNLTKIQFDQLRAQIYAFKHHLHKNNPIPPSLYPAIRGINAEKSLREYELLYKPTTSIQTTSGFISNSNFTGTGMSHNGSQQIQYVQVSFHFSKC